MDLKPDILAVLTDPSPWIPGVYAIPLVGMGTLVPIHHWPAC